VKGIPKVHSDLNTTERSRKKEGTDGLSTDEEAFTVDFG
jgi:hypothetical protein